ncbi:MAG: hypothetical protein J6R38_00960 [Alistipes sp.]|nr:hypothetical protein [Alistipes sp.]
MKKVLVLIAACALVAACSGVEKEAIKRLENIDAAMKSGDVELANKLTVEIEEWEQSLTPEDKAKVAKAVKEWTVDYLTIEKK